MTPDSRFPQVGVEVGMEGGGGRLCADEGYGKMVSPTGDPRKIPVDNSAFSPY